MSGVRSFLQGASNAAASNVSAPVDGLAWLLKKAGVNVGTPVGGSDWLRQKGLTAEAPGVSGLLGESVGGVLPMLAAAKAPQIASGLLKVGENATAPATITGPSAGQRGMILYHGSNSKTPLSSIEDRGVFGGLFASPRAASAESHGEALYRMTVPDASIMGMSDDLPFDKVKAVIKKNSAISPEHADDFAEMVLSAKSAFDSEIPEDALMKATRSTDLGEADWELQRLRGIVAKSFGYKAVEMPDEHGMSYLVLGGAVKPRPANDLARSLARGSTIIK